MLRGSLILSQQQLGKKAPFLFFLQAQKRPPLLQWSMKGMLKNNEQEKHGGNPKRVWFVF